MGKIKSQSSPPNDISIFKLEGVEKPLIKIFIILRVGVTTDEVTYVHHLGGIVAEEQVHRQVPRRFRFQNVQCPHILQLLIIICKLRTFFLFLQILEQRIQKKVYFFGCAVTKQRLKVKLFQNFFHTHNVHSSLSSVSCGDDAQCLLPMSSSPSCPSSRTTVFCAIWLIVPQALAGIKTTYPLGVILQI